MQKTPNKNKVIASSPSVSEDDLKYATTDISMSIYQKMIQNIQRDLDAIFVKKLKMTIGFYYSPIGEINPSIPSLKINLRE